LSPRLITLVVLNERLTLQEGVSEGILDFALFEATYIAYTI
jgi:hypothetical protein